MKKDVSVEYIVFCKWGAGNVELQGVVILGQGWPLFKGPLD